MPYMIPCQHCGKMLPQNWKWWICDQCGFRVCPHCLSEHNKNTGPGFRCSRCAYGHMRDAQ